MAEYLSDEEVTERLKRWWSENGTGLLVGIVLAVGGVVGWRWFDGWRVERAEAAFGRPVLSAIQTLLWQSLREAGCTDPVPGFGRLLAS